MILYFLCSFSGSTHDHPNILVRQTAQLGDNLTLKCSRPKSEYEFIFWYRHIPGERHEFIVSTFRFDSSSFYEDFDDARFTVDKEGGMFNLHISKAKLTDFTVYYCAVGFRAHVRFINGVLLQIKGNYKL